jgi:hypothetical protein
MKSACLVLLIMLSGFGFKPIDPQGATFIGQALTQATAGNKRHTSRASQFTQALADTTTVTPAAASKAPSAKAKNAGAPPCSRQPAVNHDAQVLPNRNKTQWPQPRLPAEQHKQCQAQKPLHKPPSD